MAARTIIKKCHVCGHVTESGREPERCPGCRKSFLPLNYFGKARGGDGGGGGFRGLFSAPRDLHEDDLIKGLIVLW